MPAPTRRNFLKSAGAAAAPPLAATAAVEKQPPKRVYRRSSFSPVGRPEKLTENLYRFEDTCAVYVRNYKPSAMKIEVTIIAPSEWRIEPDLLRFEVPAGAQKAQAFEITLPKD